MILGLSFENFTLLHVIISLVGIVTGLVAFAGLLSSRKPGWITHVFLITTALTTITGFLFPITSFTPALAFGVLSSLILIVAFVALYWKHLAGPWRWIYVVTALAALYLNCFVLVVQAFQKVSVLAELAPNGSEPPFAITQAALLIAFLWFGWRAARRFHPAG